MNVIHGGMLGKKYYIYNPLYKYNFLSCLFIMSRCGTTTPSRPRRKFSPSVSGNSVGERTQKFSRLLNFLTLG